MTELATQRQDAATSDRPGVHALEAEVPVAQVTLLEDRALVLRRGRFRLQPGRTLLRVEGVAPILVDKTLSAQLRPVDTSAPLTTTRVRDVKVKRRRVTQDVDRPAALTELRAQIRKLEADGRNIDQERTRTATQVRSLTTLIETTLAEFAVDASWTRADADGWRTALDRLEARAAELGLVDCDNHQRRRLLDRDIADARRREAALRTLQAEAAASLTIELLHSGAQPVDVELEVDYLVPGASWRPWHTARLVEGEQPEVEFTCAGCVWQATGEDWKDVELVFSTERPSLGHSPPTLTTDPLRIRKRGATVSVSAREQKIHTAGLGGEAPGPQVADEELPGIDDGGDPLELRGRVRATVPGDGRPCRVPIFVFEAPTETQHVCVPELALSVQLRSRQANRAPYPLLAGPVDLIRNSGLVGRTSTLFVAPGERFDIGWGPDSALRVHREVEELEHQRRTLSSWTRKPRKIKVKLSNLGAQPRDIEIQERIPVTEIEKVEVEVVNSSPRAETDDDGITRWQVHLQGLAHEEVTLEWTLVVHDDVVGM